MKHLFFILISLLFATGFVVGQSTGNKLYIVATDLSLIPSVDSLGHSDTIRTSNPQLDSILNKYDVYAFNRPFYFAKTQRLKNTYQIECNCDANVLKEALQKAGFYGESIEIVPDVELLYTPNDYNFSTSYCSGTVTYDTWHLDKINSQQAWDITKGDPNIKIAVVDNGVPSSFQEFTNADGSSQIFYSDGANAGAYHGTFVSSLAGAATDNGNLFSSIGFQCRLMTYGNMTYSSALHASQNGAKVINLSWGGTGSSSTNHAVINEIVENGSVIVAAAGNGANGNSTEYYYPASYDNVISVTSTGPTDEHSYTGINKNSCSTFTALHQYNDKVDLCAPGYNVIGMGCCNVGEPSSGTSMAAPIVAGLAGLIFSVNPAFTPWDVECILKQTAENIDGLSYNAPYAGGLGAGRINAAAAVQLAQTYIPSSVTASTYISCNGSTDGSIDLTVTGGASPYSFLWSTGAVTEDINNLTAGTYTVTVTNANGCTASIKTITITEPAALTSSETITPVSCNGATDGAINITVTGGTMPYAFLWSTGAITEDIANIGVGTYSVTVTDAHGCTLSKSMTVTQSLTVASTYISNVGCNSGNNGAIQTEAAGGTTPYSYVWNNGATTDDIMGLSSGTYTVTVTDANSCTASASFTITEPLPIDEIIGNVMCYGESNGSVTLTSPGVAAVAGYLWSNGGKDYYVNGLTAGTYTVTVEDVSGCTVTKDFIVTEPSELILSVIQTNVSCNGGSNGSIDLTPSGGTTPYKTYYWSDGSITEDISNLIAGTYTVTVTDANGCTATIPTTITEPAVISITASATAATCGTNGAIDLTVSGGTTPYAFTWSNGATTEDVTNLIAGTYTVTVADANTCTNTASATINSTLTYSNGYTVNTNETWTTNKTIKGQVVVKSSAKLTISGATIEFADNTSGITVEAGGELEIINSTLTNLSACTELWKGVDFVGYASITNTVIENALVGINANTVTSGGGMDDTGMPIPVQTFGSTIKMEACTLRNNQVGLKKYGAADGVFGPAGSNRDNSINNCKFEITASVSTLIAHPVKFIETEISNKITISQSSFNNLNASLTGNQRPVGIVDGRNDQYSVVIQNCNFSELSAGVISNRNRDLTITGSTFQNLGKGITKSIVIYPALNSLISGNTFNAVEEGIYIQNGTNDKINNNAFNNLPPGDGIGKHTFGIYLVSTGGFEVQSNTFTGTGTASASPITTGSHAIAFENTGAKGGVVFNNTMSKTDYGVHTQGDNQALKIRCNKFANDGAAHYANAWYTYNGTLRQQGATTCDQFPEHAAGNLWKDNCSSGTEKDIFVGTGVTFDYYANPNDQFFAPTPVPDCSTPAWKTADLSTNCADATSASCGSPSPGIVNPFNPADPVHYVNEVRVAIRKHRDRLTEFRNILTDLRLKTDGGSTADLIAYINKIPAASSKELQDRLMASLPLSDAAISALIKRKANVPPDMLKEILRPNAPLSDNIMAELRGKVPALPPQTIKDIEAAQLNEPQYPKEKDLIRNIAWEKSEKQLLQNDLLSNMAAIGQYAEIESVLNESATAESKKLLSEYYLQQQRYVESRKELDKVIPLTQQEALYEESTLADANTAENEAFDRYMRVLLEVLESGKTINEMNVGQLSVIREVAAAKVKVSASAEALLAVLEGEYFEHPIRKETFSSARMGGEAAGENDGELNVSENTPARSKVNLYPNPNTGTMVLEYNISDIGQFTIYDLTGKEIASYFLETGNNKITVSEAALKNGVYFYRLTAGEEIISTNKIVVIK